MIDTASDNNKNSGDWSADTLPEKWIDYSKKKIKTSLKRELNGNVAKNVIFYLGDGIEYLLV